MTIDETTSRITIMALEDDEFRQIWDKAVRDGADHVSAAILAGTPFDWTAAIPYPDDLDEQDVDLAYQYAVAREAERRMGIKVTPRVQGA